MTQITHQHTIEKRYDRLIIVGMKPEKLEFLPARDNTTLTVISDRRIPALGHFKNVAEIVLLLEDTVKPELAERSEKYRKLLPTLTGSGRVQLAFNSRLNVPSNIKDYLQHMEGIDYFIDMPNSLQNTEGLFKVEYSLYDIQFIQQIITSKAKKDAEVWFCHFNDEFNYMEKNYPALFKDTFTNLKLDGYNLRQSNTSYNLHGRLSALREVTEADSYKYAVSIIVPVYNSEKYINDTIGSILQQTFSDIEIIIIDDGSTDGSSQILRSLAGTFQNIKYVRQNNGGVSSARNLGLSLASGKYIGFLDSDDILPPDSVRRRVEFLENTEFRVCGGLTAIIGEDGASLNLTVGWRGPVSYENVYENPFQLSTLMGQSRVMKRQSFRVGQRFAEDWRYIVDLVATGERIGSCESEPLSYYRWHESSTTGKELVNHLNACVEMYDLLISAHPRPAPGQNATALNLTLDEEKARNALVARVQNLCLHDAVRAEEALDPVVVDMMDRVESPNAVIRNRAFFDNAFTRAYLLPRFSNLLYEKILFHSSTIEKKLACLRPTTANLAFRLSLRQYLDQISNQ